MDELDQADVNTQENLWADYQLGENADDIVIVTSEQNRQLAAQLVNQAEHRLDIFSRDLDARVFDNAEFCDAVRSLAVNDNKARIRFLVIDPDRAIKLGHRLLDLARRLSSTIEIRKVHEDYAANQECYLIADERGLLHRKLATRYEGIVNFNAPSDASYYGQHFKEVWEHSSSELDFKRLHI